MEFETYRVMGVYVRTDGDTAEIQSDSAFIQTEKDRETVKEVAKKRYQNDVDNELISDGGETTRDIHNRNPKPVSTPTESVDIEAKVQEAIDPIGLIESQQAEKCNAGDTSIYCRSWRIRCPECHSTSTSRTTGYTITKNAVHLRDFDPGTVNFICERCGYRGSKVYDAKTENYIEYEEYCEIIRGEI